MQNDDDYIEIGLKNRWRKQVAVMPDVRRQAFASLLSKYTWPSFFI